MKSFLRLALESAPVDGTTRAKNERVFYGKLAHPEELKTAARALHQEQWAVKAPQTEENAGKGQLRIRKEWQHGEAPNYIFTTKVDHEDGGHTQEHEMHTTEDHFELFKVIANKGMIKTRYCYHVEGSDLIWEVDAFDLPDGSQAPWVKIDLEIPAGQEDVKTPEFPVSLTEVFSEDDAKIDPSKQRLIDELYQKYFLRENEHVAKRQALQFADIDATAA